MSNEAVEAICATAIVITLILAFVWMLRD